MAGVPPDLNQARTINSLYRKAIALHRFVGMVQAAGPHVDNPALAQASATAAQQEANNCSNRAAALVAGSAYSFPGDGILNKLAGDCATLEQDIAISAGWANL